MPFISFVYRRQILCLRFCACIWNIYIYILHYILCDYIWGVFLNSVEKDWGLCNTKCPSETRLKFKSREISFAHKISCPTSPVSCSNVLKFCTTVALPCYAQLYKIVEYLQNKLWANAISWDLIYYAFRTHIPYCTWPLVLVLNVLHHFVGPFQCKDAVLQLYVYLGYHNWKDGNYVEIKICFHMYSIQIKLS